ncbi:unnamed protein product [Mytilus edulis]|uniref:Novel STAND NTPase 3 domain-containing protein n=1 Tax=Mytilus edulis TaxID=6550 RepID=A0A8S3SWN1_MYTED|nr:unnamed protein product [Mytilus edulis]
MNKVTAAIIALEIGVSVTCTITLILEDVTTTTATPDENKETEMVNNKGTRHRVDGVCETHLKYDDVLHVNSYNWIGQNRKHLHKKAKTGSGGVGLFVKKSYYEMFDIGVLDTSFEGILWVSFKHKNSDFRFNICVAYLPPENSTRQVDKDVFFDTLITQVYEHQNSGPFFICGDFNSRCGDENDYIVGVDDLCPRDVVDFKYYECLNENEWKTSFDCEPIETVIIPGSSNTPSTVKPLFGPYATEFVPIQLKDECEFKDKTASYITTEKHDIEIKRNAIEDDKRELKDKISKLENDLVKIPSHVQEFQNETLQDWTRKLKKFVITRATEFIYDKVRKRNIIVITGPTGSGKSAIAYYAAFQLKGGSVPYDIIEDEINNFKIRSQVSFIALAILAIKQTISTNSFSIDNHEYDTLLNDVFHESAFLQYPSKNLLKSSLVALTGTYVKRDIHNFKFIHETLRNIVLRCIAKTLMKSVISYCKTEVILNRLRLDCFHMKQDDCTIEVAVEHEDTYFRRLIYEMGEGLNKAIFQNEQNKFPNSEISFVNT